ncbi:MAG: succinate dehydrogenase assembly factor 2 [Burkholderiales bacterium]
MDRIAHEKLKWKCRRGRLELDLVLERFMQQQGAGMSDAERASLDELLDYPDNDLWDVVSGRSNRFDQRLGGIVARLRSI